MTPEIAPEVVERMAECLRKVAAGYPQMDEAHAIVALLPEPVDPDRQLARQIVHDVFMDKGASCEMIIAGDVIEGKRDDALVMHVALAAIKAARS